MQERENTGGPTQETIAIEKGPAGPVPTKIDYEPEVKSKTLIITDTDAILDRILNVILPQIDRKPKQVLIEARIMEVNRDRLKDIGFDYGTGLDGAATSTLSTVTTNGGQNNIGANALTSQVKPSNFTPSSSAIGSVASNFNTGLTAVFQRLNGTQFEVLMHALEEDVHANTLSSPRILTLDNQEASMLVGYHTPILSSTVTAATATEGATQTQTLDYYQEIGIRLNVVPQIGEDGYINMIIHPSVTSSSHGIDAVNVAGTTNLSTSYPVIDVREAQTQILIRDGETVVIGGLLKDVTSKSVIGIPFLGKIPFLGVFFRRETTSTSKIDLLIFITAHIVTDDEFVPSKVTRIEQQLVDPAKVARQDAIDKKKAAQDAKRANKAKK
jgi:type II secretion system protein D